MRSRCISYFLLCAALCAPPLWASPEQSAKPSVDLSVFGHVVQVGWVVSNLDDVVEYWRKMGFRGIQPPVIRKFSDVTYRGKKISLVLKMAYGDLGGAQIEWIQPIKDQGGQGGDNACNEFLQHHGDGIYYLGYRVHDPEQFAREIEQFNSEGVDTLQRGNWQDNEGKGEYAFLDTARRGGGLTLALLSYPGTGGASIPPNAYPFVKNTQFAFVVRDAGKVGGYFEHLGFGAMPVDRDLHFQNPIYRGQPGRFGLDVGWWRFGDVVYEWIQPRGGRSVYTDYEKAHGEGLHHLAYQVEDLDAALKTMQAKGVAASQTGGVEGPKNRVRFAYLDTEPHGGVTIELYSIKPK